MLPQIAISVRSGKIVSEIGLTAGPTVTVPFHLPTSWSIVVTGVTGVADTHAPSTTSRTASSAKRERVISVSLPGERASPAPPSVQGPGGLRRTEGWRKIGHHRGEASRLPRGGRFWRDAGTMSQAPYAHSRRGGRSEGLELHQTRARGGGAHGGGRRRRRPRPGALARE